MFYKYPRWITSWNYGKHPMECPGLLRSHKDRIMMRIRPKKQIPLIFHYCAKKLAQEKRVVEDHLRILLEKENNRKNADAPKAQPRERHRGIL